MFLAFAWCTNLIGNIYIGSENITNAEACFYNTALEKNVYIPFTYANGVNTLTYNAFTNYGYLPTERVVHGVQLFDLNNK
jgi:hypothetical protein